MIVGIVLAAGRSRRMGRPKPFLEMGGESFLSRAVAALLQGGCGEVVVVGGSEPAARSVAERAASAGARVALNPPGGSEQIDSLRTGLRAAGAARAVVVLPVDVPISDPAPVAALIRGFEMTAAPVVVPIHAGRRGHPVLFARSVFDDLRSPGLAEGARTVIGMCEAELVEVPVEDPRVLLDVDTPDDYRRLLRNPP